MKKAFFLDRDGVINKAKIIKGKPYPPASLSELTILDGVEEAVYRLKEKQFLVGIVTNQPDIATGKTNIELVNEINSYIRKRLQLDFVQMCVHVESDKCSCRKPKPGMLFDQARRDSIDLNESYMVGDRWRDIEAGIAAGTKTVWLENNYSEKKPSSFDYKTESLYEFVFGDWLNVG